MKRIAIYPGSFDPPTLGHQSVLFQASKVFDRVIVAVAENAGKKPLLAYEQREKLWVRLGEEVMRLRPDESVVEAAQSVNASSIVRGIRNLADLEEAKAFQVFVRQASKTLIDVVYFMPPPGLTHVSSSAVRQLIAIPEGRANLTGWVDPRIADYVAGYGG